MKNRRNYSSSKMNKMYGKYFIVTALAIILLSCNSGRIYTANSEEKIEKVSMPKHNSKFFKDITAKAQELISANKYTPFDTLQSQKIERSEENSEVFISSYKPDIMTGNEIYNYLQASTMIIGASYLCDRCPNIHLNCATGFVIHEDGVVVTNYHVIDVKEKMDISSIFASDHKGNLYPVSKILSASKANDVAILQLDTNGEKLKELPLAPVELVGETIYTMGHPFYNHYFMTKGIVGRKYIKEHTNVSKIAITADFGQGSSGGPVVNENGQLVGIVSSTLANYSNRSKDDGDLQLLIKEVIPVSVLHQYVKKSKE
ncbi:S1 family peptidase [Aestuariibaculum sediminum]|uniref:Trypsin-like peptidase domain-containing protein n=1 Tax=Aestuariibaculum sediminum TaxID=2770637 RepID=A0A8J6QLD1_9FLAO|nr:serine protease [Aestuariibaculum sediminum]MBD0833394.1 trypsin-like peptidase domain-containing protein [Aestuariibaculum sediminum]